MRMVTLVGSFNLAVLCVELPTLLPVVELAEALLHVQNGAWLLCRVVANTPDSFNEGIYTDSLCGGDITGCAPCAVAAPLL